MAELQLDQIKIFGSSLYGIRSERIFSRLVEVGVHEWAETAICQQFFFHRATVFDVGANIGYYSALMRQVVGPQGSVHSFEANPVTFGMLKQAKESSQNEWENVQILNCAVADESGTMGINVGLSLSEIAEREGYNLGGWAVGRGGGEFEIPVLTLDDYCEDTGAEPRFIKIDVEGHEQKVLVGATKLIQRKKPVLMVEFSGGPNNPGNVEDLYHMLVDFGYMVLQVHKRPFVHLKRMKREDLSDIELAYAICVHKAKALEMGY